MAGPLPPVIATFLANTTDLKAKLTDAQAQLRATATAADESAAKVEASSAKSAASSSGAMGKLASVGKVATVAGVVGIAAISVASVKAATDFNTLTTQLVTGAGESSANIDKVSKGLIAMAPAVGIGPDALAKAMFTVESAGYHGADGLNVMKAAAEGAKIGGADATVVANGLTTAMTDYAIPADQAAATTSKLVETVASGKTTMQDLSASLSNVLPGAKAAGVGLDQVLGAMATMTGEGISADQASQDLAGTIRSMSAPTAVQTQAMQALGLNSLTVAQNLGKQGLTGTMDTLVAAITQHMGPAGTVIEDTFKKSQTAAADAKTELAAMPPAMQKIATSFMNGQLTSTQWRADLKGMTTEQKQLAQQFATTVQSGQGFNDLVKSGGPDAQTFSAALAAVTGGATGMNTALALTGSNSATFAANVKNISGASADAKGNVQGWSEVQKDFGFQLDQAKAGLQAMLITIGEKLIPIIQQVIKVGTQWADYLAKHKVLLLLIAGVIGGALVVAIAAYTVSMITAAAATIAATWPILAIVAAVAAVVFGIYELIQHWNTVWNAIKGAAEDVKNFIVRVFNDVWAFLKEWGPLILTVLDPFLGLPLLIIQHWQQIVDFFSKVGSLIAGYFKDAIKWLEQAGKDILNGLLAGLKAVWDGVIKPWFDLQKTIAGWFAGAVKWLFQAGSDVITGLWNGVNAIWDRAVNGWENIGSTIKGWFNGAINWLRNAGSDIMNGLFSAIENFWNTEVRGWENIGNTIKGWFSGAAGWLEQAGKDIINGIVKGIGSMTGAVGNAIKHAVGDIPVIGGALSAIGLAEGGVVTRPTFALIGEGGEPEYVIPQSKLAKPGAFGVDPLTALNSMTQVTPAAAPAPAGGGSITLVVNVAGTVVNGQDMGNIIVSAVSQMAATHGPGFIQQVFSGQLSGSR